MGLDPGQRARRPSPDAPEAPGDGYRADLAAFLLDLPGNAPGGGGHTAAPSLCPPRHERTVCRQGYPGVPGVRYCSMGEDNQLPRRYRTVGKGVIHRSQPTGGGTARGSHRWPFPDFVQFYRGVRIAVGTAARCTGKAPGTGWRKRNGGYSRRRQEPQPCTGWSRSLPGTPRRRCGQYRRRWSLRVASSVH